MIFMCFCCFIGDNMSFDGLLGNIYAIVGGVVGVLVVLGGIVVVVVVVLIKKRREGKYLNLVNIILLVFLVVICR